MTANDVTTEVNGGVVIDVAQNRLTATLLITEEQQGGRAATFEDVKAEVARLGIAKADLDAANALIASKRYDFKIYIAKGRMPVGGVNGNIEYLFEANSKLVPKEGALGNVDYKDLGLVRNINEGELIAKITLPTVGEPGETVFGEAIPAVNGLPAKYLVGSGTVLSEDETEIRAATSGNLSWQKDHFEVEETLVIKESVSSATGNIDFIGSVLIKGNVSEGFTVKSPKDITINGSVTNATIEAGRDVNINLGSIGSTITAQGSVKLGFCESSKVECKGDFSSNSVIGGEIFCGGMFTAINGRGVVFGGKHTALVGFTANIIGTESYTKTQITLGNSAVLAEEKLQINETIRELNDRTEKLMQLAAMLKEQKKNFGQLSADRESMLTTAIRSRFTFQREVNQLKIRVKDIDKELESVCDQTVIVNKQIYPGVTIRIGTDLLIVDRTLSKVAIGKDPDGNLAYLTVK